MIKASRTQTPTPQSPLNRIFLSRLPSLSEALSVRRSEFGECEREGIRSPSSRSGDCDFNAVPSSWLSRTGEGEFEPMMPTLRSMSRKGESTMESSTGSSLRLSDVDRAAEKHVRKQVDSLNKSNRYIQQKCRITWHWWMLIGYWSTISNILLMCISYVNRHMSPMSQPPMLECLFLGTEVDCSNPDISMLCPWARHFILIASADSAVKWVPGEDNLVKGVQCYELFRGIALKNHAFSCMKMTTKYVHIYTHIYI